MTDFYYFHFSISIYFSRLFDFADCRLIQIALPQRRIELSV